MPDPTIPPKSNNRNIYVFGMTSFLNDTASEMAYWLLPAFLASIGAGPAQLGLIEGIAESMASFAKLFSGYMTDRLDRRKPMVVFGYAVANLAKPLLAIANWWWQVLAIRFADRTAKGIPERRATSCWLNRSTSHNWARPSASCRRWIPPGP